MRQCWQRLLPYPQCALLPGRLKVCGAHSTRSKHPAVGTTEAEMKDPSVEWSCVQFSRLTDWVVEGTRGTIKQRSSSRLFCRRPLWAVLASADMSTLWWCPSSISSADHCVAHPLRCPEGWFWRGCRGVWHAQAMQELCLPAVRLFPTDDLEATIRDGGGT